MCGFICVIIIYDTFYTQVDMNELLIKWTRNVDIQCHIQIKEYILLHIPRAIFFVVMVTRYYF